jgi:UDP-N-acetyl-D-glucosamine dehydrogenase
LEINRKKRGEKMTETITIVGLGYVGLPLADAFASKGFKVFGYDTSKEKVESINEKEHEKIVATTEPEECISHSDFTIICVPTPINERREPDLGYILSAVEEVGKYFKSGSTIVLESTTYPGTTEEVVKPILEKTGKDFYLAYSPERIDPGNKKYPLERVPKIVSGINKESLEKVKWLYSQIIEEIVEVSDTKTAEATKLVENVFRAVNISLANELAMIFERMGINTYEVIEAAKTKPYGFLPFYPGPGIGGHCIPVDPFYLAWKAKQVGAESKFIELAGEISYKMTKHVAELIRENTDDGAKILILGVAYKRDIPDTRNSPAELILEDLNRDRRRIDYFDPHVPKYGGLKSVEPSNLNLNEYECVVLLTDHNEFKELDFGNYNGVLIDTRNFINASNLKCMYIGIGKGKGYGHD